MGGNNTQPLVTIGAAIVGAYVGGYQGMQIGMAISGLFYAEEAKEHLPYNDPLKDSITIAKPDIVPFLIGTDISPGNPIWVDESTKGLHDPEWFGNEALMQMLRKILMVQDIQFYNIDFIASFGDGSYINQMWFDKKHHWLWMRFDDRVHFWHGFINSGWIPLTRLWYNDRPYYAYDSEGYAPIKGIEHLRFKGIMLDPKSNNTAAMMHNSIDPQDKDSEKEDWRRFNVAGGMPRKFPDLKAEVTGYGARYSTTSGYYNTDYSMSGYDHSFRDNLSHYTYGVFGADVDYNGEEVTVSCSIRKLKLYEWKYVLLVDEQYAFDNITRGYNNDMTFSRQDIDGNPDHLYIFHGRNWYYAGSYNHHHAQYQLAYDIFYIDRSDDSVHSVIYNNIISWGGDDHSRFSDSNPLPTFRVKSIELAGDSILVMGMEYQSHSIWGETVITTQDNEEFQETTKIYADFSLYPDDYWADDYAYAGTLPAYVWANFGGSPLSKIRYRVVAQTSTYIEVQGKYPAIYKAGSYCYISRNREFQQANWAVIGEGSSRSVLVVQEQFPFEPRLFDGMQYDSIVTLEDDISRPISSMGTTTTYLESDLPRDPVPGEIVLFYFGNNDLSYSVFSKNANRFYNPVDSWFIINLEKYWPNNTIPPVMGGRWRWFETGLQNQKDWGIIDILKISKTTGEFQGKFYEELPPGYGYTGEQRICVVEMFGVVSCSTDAQIAISFQCTQPYVYTFCSNIVIDKATLSVVNQRTSRYEYYGNNSHACGKSFKGALKLRVYDDKVFPDQYLYKWYALIVEYTPLHSMYITDIGMSDNQNLGTYIVDIGETGIFPDLWEPLYLGPVTEYSAMLGNDMSRSNAIKWFRSDIVTGPLYSSFFSWVEMNRDSQHFRMFDYDQKLSVVAEHNACETWIIKLPNEYNRFGFTWPMAASWGSGLYDPYWGSSSGSGTSTAVSSKYFSRFAGNIFSNWVDSGIGSAISHIESSSSIESNEFDRYGNRLEFDSSDYAAEVIDDVIYYLGEKQEIKEPRFLFSKCWDKKTTKMAMFQEIAATCQGMLVVPCRSGYTYQPVHLKIPRPNEPVIWYFGLHEQEFSCNQNGANILIYADFSNYPEGYWEGDSGYLIHSEVRYDFVVEKQFTNWIELESSIGAVPSYLDYFKLTKDNIKEGSFAFSKKPQFDKSNRIRVEFVNRLMEYTLDIAEVDDHYKQDVVDKRVILRQYELHGIKRASQAARMAMRYLDYEQFVNWLCSFQTDFLGSYICVGDIIGITHPITGWIGKQFRVKRKEEFDNHDVLLETEEYVEGVYHDYSNPVYQGGGGGANGQLNFGEIPESVDRLYVHFDPITGIAYVTFQTPQFSSSYAAAYVSYSIDGGDYIPIGIATTPTASVVYSSTGTTDSSALEPTRTKYNEMLELGYQYTDIPYDPLTMLGTFPASGYLWINGETIYYNGIDTVNNKFVNCVRCIDVPEYQYAADAPDDGYNWTNPLIVLADTANAFNYIFDDSIFVNLDDESEQSEGSEIEYHIPEVTFRVSSINLLGLESTAEATYTIQLRKALGRPYSPTLLRYVRDL